MATKLSVDVTQFKQGMREAQQSAKTFQAQMKANEAQFKATGDKEQYLTEKGKLLKGELEAQQKAAKNAEEALRKMRESGVAETSAEYQKMAQQLAGIQTAMYDTQAAMNTLSVSESKASGGAKDLNTNLSNISKNVSIDAVIKGIDGITGAMEKAISKAVDLGKELWSNITDSAKWADDAATMAQMYEVPLEKYLQMEAMVASGMDTSVEAILGSMQRMRRGIGKENKEAAAAFESLGVRMTKINHQGKRVMRDQEDLFFEAGAALMQMGDDFDKEAAAQAIFGRSWRELIPLFTEFQDKDSFNAALEEQNIVSEESVENLTALNDKLGELEHNFTVLKNEVLGDIAPALEEAAGIAADLLKQLSDYLKTDAGQEQLQKLGDAFSGIVEGLMDFDAAAVVEGFVKVVQDIVSAFTWISDNWESVKLAIEGIALALGAMKISTTVLEGLRLINGFRGMTGGKGLLGGGGFSVDVSGFTGSAIETAFANAAPGFATTFVNALSAISLPVAIMTIAPTVIRLLKTWNEGIDPEWDETMGKVRAKEGGNERAGSDPFWHMLKGDITFGEMMQEDWRVLKKQTSSAIQETFAPTEASERLKRERRALVADYLGLPNIYEQGGHHSFGIPLDFEGIGKMLMHPELAEGSEDSLQDQANDMHITAPVTLVANGLTGFGGNENIMKPHVNGLWSVPWDGYPAILHKGEQIVPNRGNSYTSNVYFGSVNLNNGLEIEALTESIDRRNRRVRNAYGS